MNHRLGASMLFLLIVHTVIVAQERFQLQSALRTGYGDGAGITSYTAYHYDSQGNRSEQRVFDGADSTQALMSHVRYTYDEHKRCIEELLLGSAADTVSIVRYLYGQQGIIRVSTLDREQNVRFSDTLLYAGGVLVEQRRHSASAQLIFYRRYGYSGGQLSSDSLFEKSGDSGAFSAMQARLIRRNADSTVASDAHWRLTQGQWYPISTTVMAYENRNLVSATCYETDGLSKRLIDSLAYKVDAHGNRTFEAYFDDERTKSYDIAFSWLDTQPAQIYAQPLNHLKPQQLAFNKGTIEFGAPVRGRLIVCALNGRQLWEYQLGGEASASLPRGLSAGSYIAMVRGTVNQSLSIIITN